SSDLDDVEGFLRQVLEDVSLKERQIRMLEELPRLDNIFRPKVDPHDHSPRPGGHRVSHRAVAAADIQYALSRRDALHEKVVILHQPVLDVYATVVFDCQTIDTLREKIVGP